MGTDFITTAVKTAVAVKKGVKVTWPREEEFGHEWYRPMAVARVRATLAPDNTIAAWRFRTVTQSIMQRFGWWAPGWGADSTAVECATSATGVPFQPPSANDRRPPSISSPPPRTVTNSASIFNWSDVNALAGTLPRITERYANSSSRVDGKPPTSSSAESTPSRRYFFSLVRCSRTTCTFSSPSSA